jgi:DNA-binding transcriptional LysR family regulator
MNVLGDIGIDSLQFFGVNWIAASSRLFAVLDSSQFVVLGLKVSFEGFSSFHDGAEHLFLTQPAVTLQIKALENDLGVRLFDRARGGITLTREGSVLLSYANKVAKLVAEAERELGRGNGRVSGELPLGVSTTIAQYVLPQLLRAFLEENPGIQLSLHSGNTSQVVPPIRW